MAALSTGSPRITLGQFRAAVESLPEELRARVAPMRSYATSGRPRHEPVQVLLEEAFLLHSTGAAPDEVAGRVAEAEAVWSTLRAEAAQRQEYERNRARRRPNQWKRTINSGYRGQVGQWSATGAPLVAATDASRRGRDIGWGYVVSDGRWGLRHPRYPGDDPTGSAPVLVNELRAVHFLLDVVDPAARLRLLVDNAEALRLLTGWRAGGQAMPPGYDLRPRSRAEGPTLVLLASRVERMPHLSLEGVRAHRGHPLNEAAHSLSVIARCADRAKRGYERPEEMGGMIDRFLAKWHRAGTARA